MNALLNAAEAAKRLRCSTAQIRKLWNRGVLPCVIIPGTSKYRKTRRVDAAALERWIQSNTTSEVRQ
jgi:hypothetical protein